MIEGKTGSPLDSPPLLPMDPRITIMNERELLVPLHASEVTYVLFTRDDC